LFVAEKHPILRIMQKPLLWLSLLSLFLLYLVMIFASYIAPYNPLEQNPEAGYAKPSSVHFDSQQGFYTYQQKYQVNPITLEKETIDLKEKRFYIRFFQGNRLFMVDKPAYLYLLGSDSLGRDIFSRIVHGSRPSLTIGFLAVLISFPLGAIYGGIAGFFGGIIDNLMMRIVEAIMSLPSFYILIILSAILPAHLNNSQRFALITVILSLISWAGLARIIRGQIQSIKQAEFIQAAKTTGQKDFMIIMKHLLPHTLSFLLVAVTLSVPGYIIGESSLSFLGLGINQPDPSWGNLLAEGKELTNILKRPWLVWTPSILIFIVVFSFNMIGDYLRDKFDPKTNN